VKKCKLSCRRVDKSTTVSIVEEIVEQIAEAKIIIADITTFNANVLYELGIAHTMNKRVVMIAEAGEEGKLPFDIHYIQTLWYRDNLAGWNKLKKDLKQSIDKILKEGLSKKDKLKCFSKGPFAHLTNIKDLIEIEQALDGNICIMTWDLINDRGVYKDTIIENLRKGTIYKYILPKNAKADMDKLLSDISKEGVKLKNKIETKYVDVEQLECTIVIYGVTDEECEKAFIMPHSVNSKEKYKYEYEYAYEVIGLAKDRIFRRFNNVWNQTP
jgi:hypothetical protein